MTEIMTRVRTISWQGAPAYKEVDVYCPGCKHLHNFIVEKLNPDFKWSENKELPVWGWDGNEVSPTFNPSMLAYSTIHLCEDEDQVNECDKEFEECGHIGHGYAWRFPDGSYKRFKVYEEKPDDAVVVVTGPNGPHVRDPAWGNCHSFLREGVWDFLTDCSHELAGRKVPMVPIPDYWINY